jgi:acetolactate synthase I/II/III large subunit
MQALMALIADAAAPIAIIGGAGWNAKARQHFQLFAERLGLPVATAFRRQDAISPSSPVYAGNLGYGPNPQLVERVRQADLVIAVGARLGEATTDGYTLPGAGRRRPDTGPHPPRPGGIVTRLPDRSRDLRRHGRIRRIRRFMG